MDETDALYVKNELLETLSAAMDAGLFDYVGFAVVDGALTAETYSDDGEVISKWTVEVIVRPA
ncbi:hypothetical protein GCM10010910_00960 [Microbacterium nanhaiense]|uniref:Uncharacterized protein n=1 Tax=Microbacterium nanhaiense TaxID=1301026 RepID=A0ABQ2MZT9_9MICO|nr:hypothetical protein [Microbacterium nanhaiense]GGO59018.1 hypothetical protein GCM10010910_00960 [Microbacterium nanhaiense]